VTVVVVGSVNADTTITVDRLPAAGQTVHARSVVRRGGGKGANVAYAAAAAARDVVLVAQVGTDTDAEVALAGLARAGVTLEHVRRCPTATGTALILVDAAGENCIVVDPGANFAWTGVEATAALEATLAPGDVVVTSFEVPVPVCVAAGRAAAAAAATFVLNPSPLVPMPPELVACSPVVVANLAEAAALAATFGIRTEQPEAAARAVAGATGAPVVVTLGAHGAGVLDGDWTVVPGRSVDVVDTTGAGDALLGTLAGSLGDGSLVDAVRAGVGYAARVVGSPGARLPAEA
jgi:ribokinase